MTCDLISDMLICIEYSMVMYNSKCPHCNECIDGTMLYFTFNPERHRRESFPLNNIKRLLIWWQMPVCIVWIQLLVIYNSVACAETNSTLPCPSEGYAWLSLIKETRTYQRERERVRERERELPYHTLNVRPKQPFDTYDRIPLLPILIN